MQRKSIVRKSRFRSGSKRAVLGEKEKRRLTQLGACIILFIVVFLGKGKMPANMLSFIQTDTDFKGAFSALGEAVSNGEPMTTALGELVIAVFGSEKPEEEAEPIEFRADSPAVEAAQQMLRKLPTRDSMLLMLGVTVVPEGEVEVESVLPEAQPEPTPTPTPQIPEYTGPSLPAGATMEYYDLGLTEVTTPVVGEATSGYGYRDHPVSGEYSFHTGIDLAADIGVPVAAFADGTVDFIGESEAYGLYIQLDHGDGITTFYCHCSELYVRKGDTVSAGQTIAAVGDTGNATGPHLHLELERDGVLLNPSYYIETVQ